MNLQPARKLQNCDEEKKFWAQNGQTYKSLYDLVEGLRAMDDACFQHHVSPTKNDFSQWIGDVICDQTLSEGLAHLSTRDAMSKRLLLRIRFLELMHAADDTGQNVRKKAHKRFSLKKKSVSKRKQKQF